MKLSFALALILFGFAHAFGGLELEGDDEIEMNINSHEIRELLISAIKILGKQRPGMLNSRTSNEVKHLNIGLNPETQPVAYMTQDLCAKDSFKDETVEDGEMPAGSNGRRAIIATATKLARNPYTGHLHYVSQPVILPTYGGTYPYPYRSVVY